MDAESLAEVQQLQRGIGQAALRVVLIFSLVVKYIFGESCDGKRQAASREQRVSSVRENSRENLEGGRAFEGFAAETGCGIVCNCPSHKMRAIRDHPACDRTKLLIAFAVCSCNCASVTGVPRKRKVTGNRTRSRELYFRETFFQIPTYHW